MISCGFRVLKSWIITFIYLPRLDYCILGRRLEKTDPGFLSYVSFIHMECLHTHPILIYFCSIINEQINKRYQYLQISKRNIYLYTKHQQIIFRWYLAITLNQNRQLIKLRKHNLINFKFSSIESFHDDFKRKLIHSSAIIQNNLTTCTTLLLDVDEHHDQKASF